MNATGWIKWAVIGIVVLFVLIVIIKYRTCKKQGKTLNVPYRCNFLCGEPVLLIAENHYYGKRDNKCYEIIDYGSEMSFKEVAMVNCMSSREKQRKKEEGDLCEITYE